MGLDMAADDTQTFAESKRHLRRTTRVTRGLQQRMPRVMPEMTPEARAAYPEERVKAAIRAVREELGWSWAKWAKEAGISDGSVRGFAEAEPGGKEQSMLLSSIMRLAWAAGVSVPRLIGETEPQSPLSPSSAFVDQLRKEIEQTAVQQGLREQLLTLHQRADDLERALRVAQKERDALRQRIAALTPEE